VRISVRLRNYCATFYYKKFVNTAVLKVCALQRGKYCVFCKLIGVNCGAGGSVGIATYYGLDGLGSNPDGDEIFRPSRPALGPTQPPLKWVQCLSWGKVQPRRAADHSPPSSAVVKEG
jgi:hypothetical protein